MNRITYCINLEIELHNQPTPELETELTEIVQNIAGELSNDLRNSNLDTQIAQSEVSINSIIPHN